MSDTAARAREQRIAEIRERESKATKGPWNWRESEDSGREPQVWADHYPNGEFAATEGSKGWSICKTRPKSLTKHSVLWPFPFGEHGWEDGQFIAHARADIPFLLEQLAAQSAAPVELKADTMFGVYCSGNPESIPKDHAIFWEGWQRVADYVNGKLRQHGYGAHNYHRAYEILGKALNLNQEFYGPAEMAQVAADRLTGKYDLPVEGQGVGPRCPKCGSRMCQPYKSTDDGLWTQRCDRCEWFEKWAGLPAPVPSILQDRPKEICQKCFHAWKFHKHGECKYSGVVDETYCGCVARESAEEKR